MKSTLLLIVILISISAGAQTENNNNIYSGGMLILQPGYTLTDNNHQQIKDFSSGIGGILRFYFYNYFTAGIYGGSQTTSYKSDNSEKSYLSLGYGGFFLGFSHKFSRIRITSSAFAGRGSVNNLHIESQSNALLEESYLYEHSVFVFAPIISADYKLTERLVLTLQAVCHYANYGTDNVLLNPTFQIGILFNR